MSRRGNCWDNAVAESFFGTLKKERIRKRIYKTREEARADLFDYIEVFTIVGAATVTWAVSALRPLNRLQWAGPGCPGYRGSSKPFRNRPCYRGLTQPANGPDGTAAS